jgi:DNA-binding PadR family transcriptional regulator
MSITPEDGRADRGTERRRPIRAGRGGSLLDLALLGVLGGGPVHGYEVKRQLDEVLPAGGGVSFGSLYPTLGRLERAGEVRGIEGDVSGSDPADGAPTGALTGELAAFRSRLRERGPGRRGRKVYAITTAGRARLVELLTNLDPADDRTFALQVAFCRHLDRPQRLSVLARRRAEVASRLEGSRFDANPSGPKHEGDPWRQSLRDQTARTLAAELAWIDDLITAEPEPDTPAVAGRVTSLNLGADVNPDDLAPTLGSHSRLATTPTTATRSTT